MPAIALWPAIEGTPKSRNFRRSVLAIAEATGSLPQNINFAIKSAIIREFLDAHRVEYASGQSATKLDPADVGETASKSTVLLECYK
jgi:hypothetical protein